MNYTQFEPTESLQSFIKCFWSLEAPAQSIAEKQRIVPDGCMEMIFNYGDPSLQVLRETIKDGTANRILIFLQSKRFIFNFPCSLVYFGPDLFQYNHMAVCHK